MTSRLSLVITAAIALVIVVVAYTTFYTVNPTEQVIVLQFGAPLAVETEPGLHAKIPWLQTVAYIDKRLLSVEVPAEEVTTQDRKPLHVDAFARWRISDPIRFNQRSSSKEIAGQRLTTILDSNVRRVLGAESFADVLSDKREQMMRDIRDNMNAEAQDFGITVVDVRLRRVDLPQTNSDAVYARMQEELKREANELNSEGSEVAQRIRARAEREVTVIKAEATREADILLGEGDAEKARILGDAYGQDPDFFAFYRSMQAYQDALSSSNTTLVLSPNSEFFRYFLQPQGSGSVSARPHKH
jgi:modulator of FtsH protease HflC